MGVEYREEPCKVALDRVRGMSFKWPLNPYLDCSTVAHVPVRDRRPARQADPA